MNEMGILTHSLTYCNLLEYGESVALKMLKSWCLVSLTTHMSGNKELVKFSLSSMGYYVIIRHGF